MSVQCFEPVVKYIIKEKWLLIVCFSFCQALDSLFCFIRHNLLGLWSPLLCKDSKPVYLIFFSVVTLYYSDFS